MAQEELQAIVDGIATLPTLPEVATKLIELLSDAEASMSEIVETISKDPATSAKVLRLTNSAYYGIPRTVTSIRQAVTLLGMGTTRNLATGLSVVKMFGTKGESGGFNYHQFWRHSVGAGYLCSVLAKKAQADDADMLFLGGLLHDIGKVVIAQYEPETIRQVLLKVKSESMPMYEAEREVMGVTHADVGVWLCERWQLPEKLIDMIRLHHDKEAMKTNVAVAVCELTNYICSVKGTSSTGFEDPRLNKDVWETLEMDAGSLKGLLTAVDGELEASEAFLSQA